MKNKRFLLVKPLWLFLLVFIIATNIWRVLIGALLVIAFKLRFNQEPETQAVGHQKDKT